MKRLEKLAINVPLLITSCTFIVLSIFFIELTPPTEPEGLIRPFIGILIAIIGWTLVNRTAANHPKYLCTMDVSDLPFANLEYLNSYFYKDKQVWVVTVLYRGHILNFLFPKKLECEEGDIITIEKNAIETLSEKKTTYNICVLQKKKEQFSGMSEII